jgi:signal transduction histidine kinase
MLGFLRDLSDELAAEQQDLHSELNLLRGNIEHINGIVTLQQNYASVSGLLELLPVTNLVEDALRINAGAMERHKIQVVREFSEAPPVLLDKHKTLQILVNLIQNANYALRERGHEDKRLVLRVGANGNQTVNISVSDNGIGIEPKNLTRIFAHGFTTRKDGHGFGLHSGALAAKEMGGSLTAHSDGIGQGACFKLELPYKSKESDK